MYAFWAQIGGATQEGERGGGGYALCLSFKWNHVGRVEAPNRSSQKESLELGFGTNIPTASRERPHFESYSWCPTEQERAFQQRKQAQNNKWDQRLEAQQVENKPACSFLFAHLTHYQTYCPFHFHHVLRNRWRGAFHSENSEVCVHLPHPVFQISTLLIHGKIQNKKTENSLIF